MPANFCTNCGQRLQRPMRFCDNCGTPVEDLGPGESASAVRQPLKPGLAGLDFQVAKLFREPAAQETDTRPWGIYPFELRTLLGCSFVEAPLDSGFLVYRSQEAESCKLAPLHFVDSLQGMKVEGCANVSYYIVDAEFKYIADESRSALAKGVSEAYLEAQRRPVCHMDLYVCFKPRDEGPLGEELQGKWITCVDQHDVRDVRANLQLPLSGSMMKQRLREHERWAAAVLARVKDGKVQTVLNRVIASVRAAQKQIPDGFVHHAHCVAYYTQNDKPQDTVLIKEEPEQAEPAGLLARPPQRALQMLGGEAGLPGDRPPKSLRARLWSETAFSGSVKRL